MVYVDWKLINGLLPNVMECPSCLTTVEFQWATENVPSRHYDPRFFHETRPPTPKSPWSIIGDECLACSQMVAYVFEVEKVDDGYQPKNETLRLVLPQFKKRDTEHFGNLVPSAFFEDYSEAIKVVDVSPKAAAILVRRALQCVLNDRNFKGKSLFDQVEAMVKDQSTPEDLRIAVDLIRNFGNFGAHPLTDRQTLTLVDVEPNEAESCIQLLEELFLFYYVEPARRRARLDPLKDKVEGLGKPILGSIQTTS